MGKAHNYPSDKLGWTEDQRNKIEILLELNIDMYGLSNRAWLDTLPRHGSTLFAQTYIIHH
uniref:Uncharacterized protein n=1 Tax=Rhizophora mucronata TaxID=61149 RepID=A0A2P2IT37_RHIMU